MTATRTATPAETSTSVTTRANRQAVAWCSLLLSAAALTTGCAGADSSEASTEGAPSAPTAGKQLFVDSFDDDSNGWALPANSQGRTDVEGGDFVWESKTPNLRPHLLAAPLAEAFDRGNLRMRNVVVTATFTPERGKAAVGVFCRENHDTDADFQWYEFVARDGYAAIRQADSAGNLDVLAKTTKAQLPLGEQADLRAACVDDDQDRAQLWLTINGNTVLFARDAKPLGNGAPGLQAYDAPENASKARFLLRWHDFTVSQPTS